MARASAGLTPAWAWAAEKWSAGSKATPPTNPLRVTVFMTLDPIPIVSNLLTSVTDLRNLLDAGRLPGAGPRRQNRRRLGLRPVQAHHQIDGVARRGQPIGFLVGAGRVLLDVEGDRSIPIFLHVGQ